ncbi:MAG TPA: hypothetical protein H9871_09995, partial [Candidatus Nesterenkonia stercoripullorum]|nr:hypothetical protein [Candidatus Nesterenkonia stercoripullorum]
MTIEELRIHGVGGSSGADLLGVASADDVVVVGEGRETVFYARRADRSVEGYVWGRLTSNRLLQPLWVLLLPFTLINVAGWAHHPFFTQASGGRRGSAVDPAAQPDSGAQPVPGAVPWRISMTRGSVHAAAALLTASCTVWAAIILVDIIGYRWLATAMEGAQDLSGEVARTVGVGIGVVALVAAGVIAGLLSRSSRAALSSIDIDPETARPVRRRSRWGARENLSDTGFFAHTGSSRALLAWHLGTVAGVGAALVWKAVASWGEPALGFGEVFLVIGLLQFVVIILLAALTWDLFFLPAAAVTLAIALTNGVFSGVTMLLTRLFADPESQWGPEMALVESFVLTLAAWVLAAAVWALHWASRGSAAELPPRMSAPAEMLDGVAPDFRRKIAWIRGLAAGAHRAPQLVVLLAGLFVLSSGIAVLLRFDPAGDLERWLAPPEEGLLTSLASIVLPGLVIAAAAIVWFSTWHKGLRRGVGIIWDVLTFWPRRFHPMAIRPYTERAVPECRARIVRHTEGREGLLISAHSQGAVIAFAALAALPPEQIRRSALLSYGNPLRTLYAQVFPAYLGALDQQRLLGNLAAGGGQWINLYRLTDAIGGPAFKSPFGSESHRPAVTADGRRIVWPGGESPGVDVEVPDPAEGQGSGWAARDEPETVESLRPAWTGLCGHSYYEREELFKKAVVV